jgi:5'-nucleotidase
LSPKSASSDRIPIAATVVRPLPDASVTGATAGGSARLASSNGEEGPVVRLVVGISSRALFDLAESHRVFETEGVEAYCRYQIGREETILEPGVAFVLVKKLLALNERLGARGKVEVILLSRNSADTGLRIFNSVHHYGLDISRAAFAGGASPYRYVTAFGAHLFLSADPGDVRLALRSGCAAAAILPFQKRPADDERYQPLRIAFDGDAVVFSDEAEQVYRRHGLDAFNATESASAREPLRGGPFKAFLAALHQIQSLFPADDSPLRTALITSRGAPSHERVIRTLRAWGIRIDEALFLGGLDKSPFLKVFKADIFFDDQEAHCDSAKGVVATGHVPHGIANEG